LFNYQTITLCVMSLLTVLLWKLTFVFSSVC